LYRIGKERKFLGLLLLSFAVFCFFVVVPLSHDPGFWWDFCEERWIEGWFCRVPYLEWNVAGWILIDLYEEA